MIPGRRLFQLLLFCSLLAGWLAGWLMRDTGAAQFGEEPVQGSEQAACDGEEDPVWFWGHCYSADVYIVDRMKSEGERVDKAS